MQATTWETFLPEFELRGRPKHQISCKAAPLSVAEHEAFLLFHQDI